MYIASVLDLNIFLSVHRKMVRLAIGKAVQLIDQMDADFGGTNIFSPLSAVL
jgi:hypothetical protein